MTNSTVDKLYDIASKKRVLLIGDIMIDSYIEGSVTRLSPEAPIPVLRTDLQPKNILGGCGNVAVNLNNIGIHVDAISVIGNDLAGVVTKYLVSTMENINYILYTDPNYKTIVKTRYVEEHTHYQLLRVDIEDTNPEVSNEVISKIIDSTDFNQYDYIILSDYDKGLLDKYELLYEIGQSKAKLIIDPKPNNMPYTNKAYILTPNVHEYEKSSYFGSIDTDYIVVTLGKEGILLRSKTETTVIKLGNPVHMYNVSGAGDVVLAVISACMMMDLPIVSACIMANDCASYTITEPYTSRITYSKFIENLLCIV